LSLGLAWRGAFDDPKTMVSERCRPEGSSLPRASSGLPISVHVSNARVRAGQIAVLAKEKFLGEDVQCIHAIWVTPRKSAPWPRPARRELFRPTRTAHRLRLSADGRILAGGVTVGLSVTRRHFPETPICSRS